MDSFNEINYKRKIDAAVEKVKLILDSSRKFNSPDSVEHQYDDKYILAQSLTSTAIVASFATLSKLAEPKVFRQILVEWAKAKEVSLRFESFEKCEFVKETNRDIENPHKLETKVESTSGFFGNSTSVSKSYTTITEYYYKFSFEYRLVAFKGVGAADADGLVLQQRTGFNEIVIRAKDSPYPASTKFTFDVNISWLLRKLSGSDLDSSSFSIDRSKRTCRTPRRNDDIDEAIKAFAQLYKWCDQVITYIKKLFDAVLNFPPLHSAPPAPPVDGTLDTSDVFQPVIALFEDCKSRADSATKISVDNSEANSQQLGVVHEEVVLDPELRPLLISEQARTIDLKLSEVAKQYASASTTVVISVAEANILVLVRNVQDIAISLAEGVAYIEDMLYKQLTAAIGKIVQPEDFAEYMRFHLKKLFLPQYAPRPFSFSVRRSELHSPEGTLRVDGGAHPVTTISTSHSVNDSGAGLMQFLLNASTQITFGGDRYLHALLLHSFQNSTGPRLELVCEARQFSGFIVLIGRISSASVFEPSQGIIIRDKDELKIPLNLETIPTPKEFKDAIKSLSPEQQRFAQAFRSMQLQSTLFGICVIQIKPQLETVLNLLPDSLTKEIQLTQDLMELFIKYQIPADLLSFDGSGTADSHVRLTAVKGHVEAIKDMLKVAKEREVEEKKMELQYAVRDDLLEQSNYSGQIDPFSSANETVGFGGGAPIFKVKSKASRSYSAAPPPATQAYSRRALSSTPFPCLWASPAPTQQEITQQASASTNRVLSSHAKHNLNQLNVDSDLSSDKGLVFDYTKYPTRLDRAYEVLDVDSALRPTIITAGQVWNRRRQKALLDTPINATLSSPELSTEQRAAFDLLDALTRSGALHINDAALHVVIAATHSFDKSVVDTVVQDNLNPIERVERSALIMASVIHSEGQIELLITDSQRDRARGCSPMLFIGDSPITA